MRAAPFGRPPLDRRKVWGSGLGFSGAWKALEDLGPGTNSSRRLKIPRSCKANPNYCLSDRPKVSKKSIPNSRGPEALKATPEP